MGEEIRRAQRVHGQWKNKQQSKQVVMVNNTESGGCRASRASSQVSSSEKSLPLDGFAPNGLAPWGLPPSPPLPRLTPQLPYPLLSTAPSLDLPPSAESPGKELLWMWPLWTAASWRPRCCKTSSSRLVDQRIESDRS